jgi:hypothetical protein
VYIILAARKKVKIPPQFYTEKWSRFEVRKHRLFCEKYIKLAAAECRIFAVRHSTICTKKAGFFLRPERENLAEHPLRKRKIGVIIGADEGAGHCADMIPNGTLI